MTPSSCLGGLVVAACLASGAASWASAAEPVDLELVLAVDVSGSIDRQEATLQRHGYVAALTDPLVLHTVRQGAFGRVAMAYVEWAGAEHRRLVVDWTSIHDQASAHSFAAAIAAAPALSGVSTSISGAIEFAVPLFGTGGFKGARRVIDISGDGPNNQGALVALARDRALAAGITINGLAILNDRPNRSNFPSLPDLDLYYEGCVIGGPGAFVIVADGFATFATAIRKKLILEIAGLAPRRGAAIPARLGRGVPHGPSRARPVYAPGCDIGERQLREYFRGRMN
ncbi:MAG: DUF1194 domain-containing protein [Pseudomonadota bacterium]